jgi:hypothetical protein
VVVWLDDLVKNEFVKGLTPKHLDWFCTSGEVVVIATMRSQEYEEALVPVDKSRQAGRDVIEWFGPPVRLSEWSDAEIETLKEATDDPGLVEKAETHGLSAYLGGGPIALDYFENGADTNPVGHVLVRIAADWRRVGIRTPIPRDVLDSRLPSYPVRRGVRQPAATDVDSGLAWATTLLHDTVALLAERDTTYEVLDYILDEITEQNPSIPDLTWYTALGTAIDTVIERDSVVDLYNVGISAKGNDRDDIANAAWRAATEAGRASSNRYLGYELADDDETGEAEAQLHAEAEAGDVSAMTILGYLFEARDDEASKREAETWWRAAAEAGYPFAMNKLALGLARRSDDGSKAEAEHWRQEFGKRMAAEGN